MGKKDKKFKRKLGYIIFRILVFICQKLPVSVNCFLGGFLGSIFYYFFSYYTNTALESVKTAFPKALLRERKKIVKGASSFMGRLICEFLWLLARPKRIKEIVEIKGKEFLDLALSKGKGVILFSAHLGSFPLLSLRLVREGYLVNIVARPMRDVRINDYVDKLRVDSGVKTIFSYPRKQCIKEMIAAVRRNEIVIIQMDQNFGTGGIWVKFFGKLAATPIGSVVLALRTNAALVPGYIFANEKGQHTIEIFPQEEFPVSKSKEETIFLMTIRCTQIIESWIRKYPMQWGWIHRRWKSTPPTHLLNIPYKIEK